MCLCKMCWKGCPRNDLYCVGWDVKSYSLSSVKVACFAVNLLVLFLSLSHRLLCSCPFRSLH